MSEPAEEDQTTDDWQHGIVGLKVKNMHASVEEHAPGLGPSTAVNILRTHVCQLTSTRKQQESNTDEIFYCAPLVSEQSWGYLDGAKLTAFRSRLL